MNRILVTGCGGIGGVNFVRALRFAETIEPFPKFYILGTDFNQYYIRFAETDQSLRTPRHSDPTFTQTIEGLVKKNGIEFLHPNPSSEARVVKQRLEGELFHGARTLMPALGAIAPKKDEMKAKLVSNHVPTPSGVVIESEDMIGEAFSKLGKPLWIRAREGAGARLSLKVDDVEEAELWLNLCVRQGRARMNDFIAETYLPGRDLAYDSLWYRGKLISSSLRQRIEYPLRHISLTGLTGTPSVAMSIIDAQVSETGKRAVLSLDEKPNGFFSVDLKENESGQAMVTEVDGKWHTTASLWGMAVAMVKRNNRFNVAYQYVKLGLGLGSDLEEEADLYGKDSYLIRQMDSGVLLVERVSGSQWKIE